jgi:hypothetical protein
MDTSVYRISAVLVFVLSGVLAMAGRGIPLRTSVLLPGRAVNRSRTHDSAVQHGQPAFRHDLAIEKEKK